MTTMTNKELQKAIDSTRKTLLAIETGTPWDEEEWSHLKTLIEEQGRRATEKEVEIDEQK